MSLTRRRFLQLAGGLIAASVVIPEEVTRKFFPSAWSALPDGAPIPGRGIEYTYMGSTWRSQAAHGVLFGNGTWGKSHYAPRIWRKPGETDDSLRARMEYVHLTSKFEGVRDNRMTVRIEEADYEASDLVDGPSRGEMIYFDYESHTLGRGRHRMFLPDGSQRMLVIDGDGLWQV